MIREAMNREAGGLIDAAPARKLSLVPPFWTRAELTALEADPACANIARDLVRLFTEIDGVGLHQSADGKVEGYYRLPWTFEDALMRIWFAREAAKHHMSVEVDNAGNQWAWWTTEKTGEPSPGNPGILMASHLDSVAGGGMFDGVLGVVSGFCAISELQRQGVEPRCPIGVANWSNEEGSRFGSALFGTRVLTGIIDPTEALRRKDGNVTLRDELDNFDALVVDALRTTDLPNKERLRRDARAPRLQDFGTDEQRVSSIKHLFELHVDLGIYTERTGYPVTMQSYIWPHGRWVAHLKGQSNHAGSTPMDFRRDPVVAASNLCLTVRATAEALGMLATVGRMDVVPGGINVVASDVSVFIDARAENDAELDQFLEVIGNFLKEESETGPCTASMEQISRTPATHFDPALEKRACQAASAVLGWEVESFGMGPGHDAGTLARAGVSAAMFIVSNDAGVSHSPDEHARLADCTAGVRALVAAVEAVL